MAAALSEDSLVKKLMGVLNTQDSVQTMSLWILHHKANHEQIVEIWLKVLKKAKIPHRLTMYYVANDVVQNCKKKHAVMFLSAFQSVLRDATVFVRDSSIKVKIERILKIWEERGVFESDFVEELRAILSKTKSLPAVDAKILADFKPTQLIESIVNYKRLESEAELRQKQVASLRVDATNAEILKQLKDRSGGKLFVQEFEDSGKKLESFVEALTNEIAQESAMLEQLEQSQIFYDTQYSEAKIVANAYKNFGTRVGNLKKKLDELKKTLPDPLSPVMSPDVNAPSPGDTPPLDPTNDNRVVEDMEMSDADEGFGSIVAAGPVRQAAAARYIPRPVPPPVVVKVDEGYSKKKDDIFSISPVPSPPSPDGSPDGLSLSPRHKSVAELTKELTSGTNKGSLSLESKLQSFLNNSIAGSTNQTTIVDANADLPQGPKPTSQYVEKTSSPSPSAEDQPDWLTEMALAEMDWSGDPDKAGSTPVRDEPEVVEEKTETAKNPIDFLTRIVNTAKTKPVGMTTSFLDNLQMLTSASKREQQQQQHAGDAMSPATVAANGKAPPLVGKMPSPPKVPPPSLPPANHPVSPAPAPAARTGSPDRAQPLDVYSLSQPPPPPPSNTTHGDAGFAAERGVAPANAFGSFMASFAAAATAPPASAAYSTSQFTTSAAAESAHAGTFSLQRPRFASPPPAAAAAAHQTFGAEAPPPASSRADENPSPISVITNRGPGMASPPPVARPPSVPPPAMAAARPPSGPPPPRGRSSTLSSDPVLDEQKAFLEKLRQKTAGGAPSVKPGGGGGGGELRPPSFFPHAIPTISSVDAIRTITTPTPNDSHAPQRPAYSEQGSAPMLQPAYSDQGGGPPQRPAYSEQGSAPMLQPAYSEQGSAPMLQPAYSEQGGAPPQRPAYSDQGGAPPQRPAYSDQGGAPPQRPAYSDQGGGPPQRPAYSDQGGGPTQRPAYSEQGSAPMLQPAYSAQGGAPLHRPAYSEQGSAPMLRPTYSEQGGGPLQRPAYSDQGSAPMLRPTYSEQGSAPMLRPTYSEQGSAPMLRPTYSEQGSAPMLRPTYSEQGGGPPHLSNIAANSSGGPPAPQEPALSSPPPHYRQIGRYDDGGYADRYPSDNRNRYNHRPAADRYDQYRDYSAHAREPQWQQSYRSEHPYQRNDPYRPPPPKRYPPPPPSHPHQAFY